MMKERKRNRKQMIVGESVKMSDLGKDVFIVDSDTYQKCRLGKRYHRYEKYVGTKRVGKIS